MASGAPALALKAAAVAAVLAVLIVPSLGRCPSLGPEQPLPPAPAPAPGPAMSCSDCHSRCTLTCDDIDATCRSSCTPPSSVDCNGCANGTVHDEQCRQCFNGGQQCQYCRKMSYMQCNGKCYSQCYALGACA